LSWSIWVRSKTDEKFSVVKELSKDSLIKVVSGLVDKYKVIRVKIIKED